MRWDPTRLRTPKCGVRFLLRVRSTCACTSSVLKKFCAPSCVPLCKQHGGRDRLPVFIVQASEWISMDDKAALAVRSKRDSSMRVGLKMIREGRAGGFVTAGNTGAAMATAKMVLGSLSGIDRPALATAFPTSGGSPVRAARCRRERRLRPRKSAPVRRHGPRLLEECAAHRAPAHRPALERRRRRQGRHAGPQHACPCCANSPRELDLNFIGNVEGRDIFNGHADVIVCDGFVGNVALKTCEGTAKMLSIMLKESLKSTMTSQVGALLSRKAFMAFKKRLDYSEYGGAQLLGVRGPVIVGHGSSNERAIMNCIRVAAEFAAGRSRIGH